ncbi:MAG: CPBP family intramembrane metalloprotease [Bacteroidetes bacterium]|nr:CPBP family intramembrane metalloprotease [Bacteroidota bacterium]
MRQTLFYDIHPFVKLIMALFITMVSFLVFLIIGMLVALPVFHLSVFELQEIFSDFENVRNIAVLKYFQIVQTLGLFVVPPFIIVFFLYGEVWKSLQLKSLPEWHMAIRVILIMIIGLPVINLLAMWNLQIDLPQWLNSVEEWMKAMEETAKKLTDMFLTTDSIGGFLINLLMIAILPAVGEELLFRGILQRFLIEWLRNRHVGVLIASILFSALHLQFFGFFPRLLLGILFGYLFLWSKNLWLPILAHFVNNGVAVIFYFVFGADAVEKEINLIGTESSNLIVAMISLVLVTLLVVSVYREEVKSELK